MLNTQLEFKSIFLSIRYFYQTQKDIPGKIIF